jgi:electron transfer flavoprotein alpha subunit
MSETTDGARPQAEQVLVVAEHSDGRLTDATRATLTLARALGGAVEAAVLGGAEPAVAADLAAYGATRVHTVEHGLLADYAPEAAAEALVQLLDACGASALLAAGSDRGNEVLAHVAARTGRPMAANCTAVEPGAAWTLTRQRWGGILLEDARLTADVKIATVAPHAVRAVEAPAQGDVPVQPFAPTLDETLARTRVVDRITRDEGVSLATAPVVVSGGRGVGSAEGFAVLEELAELLGGAVGCSRVATNNGWRPHADQVGQTGTRVAPELYIACGISGATQHWVGCMPSKKILAINTDKDAPMVQRADYAVIGNLHDFLPALVAEVRARKGG